jgi:hypothetical protein
MPACFPAAVPAHGPQHQHAFLQQQQHQQAQPGPMQQQPQPQQQQHWQKQAQQLWKPQAQQQAGDTEPAPVPWSAFAADDCGDDLDKDLQELIMLPADCMQQQQPGSAPAHTAAAACGDPAAAAAAAPGPAAAAKARSSCLKRVGSTASAYSTAEGLVSAAAGVAAGQTPSNSSKAKRGLRIRGIKAPAGGSSTQGGSSTGAGPSTGSGRIILKGSTKRNQQQQAALGVAKAGVQKKVAINSHSSSPSSSTPNKQPSTNTQAPGSMSLGAGKHTAAGLKLQQQQQGGVKAMQIDGEPSLSVLGDLDSSLSGGDALTAGIMAADDVWDSFLRVGVWDMLPSNHSQMLRSEHTMCFSLGVVPWVGSCSWGFASHANYAV